ncbi:MAG: biotin/lipoate A/B protein ligase family protein [Candidatus Binatia bacterium]
MSVDRQIAADLAMLDAVERGAAATFRTWRVPAYSVVLSRSADPASEIDERFCADRGMRVARRPSGGGAVVIGPGTLQYAFALPYRVSEELLSIESSKRFCNRLLLRGLPGSRPVGQDPSGDLILDGRKVAGLALKRRRRAMLLHGTILMSADIALISRVLKHPPREPAYRRGRPHQDFLTNWGSLDQAELEACVERMLSELE